MGEKKKEKKKTHLKNILERKDKYTSVAQPYLKLKFFFIRHSYMTVMFA